MSETKQSHTPEPWAICPELVSDDVVSIIAGEADCSQFQIKAKWIAELDGANLDGEEGENEANARRIVAAVNAVAGLSTESLEAGVVAEMVEALGTLSASLNAFMASLEVEGVKIPFAPCEALLFPLKDADEAARAVLAKTQEP